MWKSKIKKSDKSKEKEAASKDRKLETLERGNVEEGEAET